MSSVFSEKEKELPVDDPATIAASIMRARKK